MRQAAQHLIKIAHRHVASGSGVRGSALENLFGAGIVGGQSLAGLRGHVFQAGGQQRVPHFGEVLIPVDLPCQLGRSASVGSVHELDVLQMIHARAIRGCGNCLRYVGVRGQSEFVERGEEMIVAGFVARLPVAHRPGVDHLVVEHVIAVSAACRRLGGVVLAGVAGRGQQPRRRPVHAQAAGGREIHQIFGINRAIQMIVQISTLGQVAHKGQQQRRLLAYGVQVAGRALLSTLGSAYRSQQQGAQQLHQ